VHRGRGPLDPGARAHVSAHALDALVQEAGRRDVLGDVIPPRRGNENG
jgi:hypothetical protein